MRLNWTSVWKACVVCKLYWCNGVLQPLWGAVGFWRVDSPHLHNFPWCIAESLYLLFYIPKRKHYCLLVFAQNMVVYVGLCYHFCPGLSLHHESDGWYISSLQLCRCMLICNMLPLWYMQVWSSSGKVLLSSQFELLCVVFTKQKMHAKYVMF